MGQFCRRTQRNQTCEFVLAVTKKKISLAWAVSMRREALAFAQQMEAGDQFVVGSSDKHARLFVPEPRRQAGKRGGI